MTEKSAGRTVNGIVGRSTGLCTAQPVLVPIQILHLRRLLHFWVGIRNAPGILSSNVARIALFALASCARWPSVVCFAVLTQAGMCETSWSSEIKVNFRAFPVLRRCSRVRVWVMVNPYCGACARTRTKPSSVIEQVASSGTPLEARVCTQPATRSWNSCWRKPNATRPFTSRRYFTGSQIRSRRPVCCSGVERLDLHSAPEGR